MTEIRWKQRFENLQLAISKLQKAADAVQSSDNELFKIALVQCFEFSFELSWKTMKDYLKFQGLNGVSLPREVIKKAFSAEILEDGQVWIDMLEDRNLMSHTYSDKNAKKATESILKRYFPAILKLKNFFLERL